MRATTIIPLPNLHNLQSELDGMFRQFPFRSGLSARWSPRVDTHETEDAFLVAVDLPGVAPEDVAINLDKGVLTVSGERKSPFDLNGDTDRKADGRFEHAFPVPDSVDIDSIDATYKDGVMTITLRKSKESKPRQIPINVG